MKNKLISLFIIASFLTSQLSFAEGDVVFIKKGTPAPEDGYLFPPLKAEEQRNVELERNKYKLLNTSLETSVDILKESQKILESKVTKLSDQNDKLAESLYQEKDTQDAKNILIFGLGLLSMGVAFFGASKVIKGY